MAITVEQHWQGYGLNFGDSPSADSEYYVTGTDDETEAWNALFAFASQFLFVFGGLLNKKDVRIDERLSEDSWLGSVTWSSTQNKEVGGSTLSFDTGGGSQHITQSFGRTAYAPSGETPPDVRGIGDNGQSVEGVDIVLPQLTFSETHLVPPNLVTTSYVKDVARITGKLNGSAFRGFAAREVLFLGASGSQSTPEYWEISYRFSASENAVGLAVDNITGIAKGGHDYLWVRYREEVDAGGSHALVQVPVAVYVEKVYANASFGGLLI